MHGLLNIDKPSGCTSRDVVNHVQRLVRPAKAGHAGTLDPLATGVLVVCVGQATRLIEYVQRLPKSYRAEFLLGRTSDTEDVEGQVVELAAPPVPTYEQVVQAAARFVGPMQQRPPRYSALKVDGRRAYDLARAGQHVELASRTVIVHELTVCQYEYPRLVLDVQCGSGTYVRSLGRDLAESLGTAAVMAALRRTAIGTLRVEQAVPPEALTRDTLHEFLMPLRRAVEALPTLQLDPDALRALRHGRRVDAPPQTRAAEAAAGEWAVVDASGQLQAIVQRRGRFLLPVRNLSIE
jgi:tRNA pseudouridine55 synthase